MQQFANMRPSFASHGCVVAFSLVDKKRFARLVGESPFVCRFMLGYTPI